MRVAFERRPYEDVEILASVCIRLMKVQAMAAFGDEFLRARRPGRTGSNFATGFMALSHLQSEMWRVRKSAASDRSDRNFRR